MHKERKKNRKKQKEISSAYKMLIFFTKAYMKKAKVQGSRF